MTTRKTYELPDPSRAVSTNDGKTYNEWFVDDSVEVDNYSNATVSCHPQRKTICIDMSANDYLVLNYHETERVALALLAAVEETKAYQKSN